MDDVYRRLPCSLPFPQGIQKPVLLVLLSVWVLAMLVPAFTPCVYAAGQRGEKEPSVYTSISKKELLSLFQGEQVVKDRVITGADLIALIRDTDVKIQIHHSVIEGGLDFTTLPRVPLDK